MPMAEGGNEEEKKKVIGSYFTYLIGIKVICIYVLFSYTIKHC